ncbi:hypothetical protein MHSWG343_06290 [Candidatus Mycoplasma haematohominis]|uniref:Uncharacterized protein n=1 Tax=Candidatus Mycoplasma haematohominis TaxID=1494318 RepID=A0A478FQK9_9MOLU|nr:hypothetical protein MHSWG343_06290 [Candidatus Mycoplasma haemohominis]
MSQTDFSKDLFLELDDSEIITLKDKIKERYLEIVNGNLRFPLNKESTRRFIVGWQKLSTVNKIKIVSATFIGFSVAISTGTIYGIDAYNRVWTSNLLINEIVPNYEELDKFIDRDALYKAWNAGQTEFQKYLSDSSSKYLNSLQEKVDNTIISEETRISKLVQDVVYKYNQLQVDIQKAVPNFPQKPIGNTNVSITKVLESAENYLKKGFDEASKKIATNLGNQKSDAFSKTLLQGKQVKTEITNSFANLFQNQNYKINNGVFESNKYVPKMDKKINEIKTAIESDVSEIEKIFKELNGKVDIKNATLNDLSSKATFISVNSQQLKKQIEEKLKKLNEKIEGIPKALFGTLLGNNSHKIKQEIEKIPEAAKVIKTILKNLIDSKTINRDDFEKLKKDNLGVYYYVETFKQHDKLESICDNIFKSIFIRLGTFGMGCQITRNLGKVQDYDTQLIWSIIGLLCMFETTKSNNSNDLTLYSAEHHRAFMNYVPGQMTNWFSENEIEKIISESRALVKNLLS